MLDKYKVIRKAEKFVIEKKFSQAIREYERLLQKEGEDPSLLNTIGDLLIRIGKPSEALKYFHKVARIYLNSGFALRAIATYKKIHSLDPSDLSVNQNLAALFEKQGLNQDACRHLGVLIRHQKQSGNLKDAMRWMEKAIELSPEQPDNHLHLAQTLAEQGERSQATSSYLKAVKLLLKKKKYERVIEACRQAMLTAEFHGELGEAHAEAAETLSRLDEADGFLTKGLAEDGPFLPLTFGLAMLAERKGEISRASGMLDQLVRQGRTGEGIQEAIERLRAASFLDSKPSDQEIEAGPVDLDAAAGSEAEGVDQAPEFDFIGEDWGQARQEEAIEESPFHPAGAVEEFVIEDEQSPPVTAGQGSGLSLQDEGQGIDSAREGIGLFQSEADGRPEAFQLDSDFDQVSEEAQEGTVELQRAESGEPSGPDERESKEEEGEHLDDYSVVSLEEALEEADFYLKLGFQEEATRVLKVLVRDYPEDERVLRRAKKIPGLAPVPPREQPAASDGRQAAQFDQQVDDALDILFEGDGEEALPEDEILRYDVQKSGQPRDQNPKVHYDLGLAYKEMGLVEDAIQEFLSAVKLLQGKEHIPQRILCCSTLANSYLQLDRYDDAIRWAREGLQIKDMKEFEWKALQYDLGCALESKKEFDPALDVFRQIADRDQGYRDVPARIDRLAAATG